MSPAALTNGRVTVVIPTHNRAMLLRRAIDSALAQTAVARCDIVVVDDGSTDDTPHVAAAYAGRIRYVRRDNSGPAVARNTAIRACPNEFAAFLDDDDQWQPDKIEHQVAVFTRWPEVVLVGGRSVACDPHVGSWPHPVPVVAFDIPVDLAPALFETNFLPTPTVMVRTAALLAVGGFDRRLRRSEDAHAWIRIACRGPGVYLDRHLATFSAGTPGLSADLLGLLTDQLRARHLLQPELVRRPDCRPHWRRGVAQALVDLRDVAYRQGRYALAARYAARSLLHAPWGRPPWEWLRLLDAACRAVFTSSGRPQRPPAGIGSSRGVRATDAGDWPRGPTIASTQASHPDRR